MFAMKYEATREMYKTCYNFIWEDAKRTYL